jgi:hypothetical protein
VNIVSKVGTLTVSSTFDDMKHISFSVVLLKHYDYHVLIEVSHLRNMRLIGFPRIVSVFIGNVLLLIIMSQYPLLVILIAES